jgi:hypothetical protein
MSITRTIIATAAIVASVAMVAPAFTGAQTVSVTQLMQEIAALQSQLNGLNGSVSASSAPAACAGITFTRNLTVGSTGSDVKCLQAILNLSASTQVSTTGAGSPGNESTYFGAKTLAAVKIWQVAAGFTPANQVGPLSRAKLNAWLAGSTTSTGTGTTGTTTQTGPVSVSLSSDNPAAGSIVAGQSTADLAHFTFNGTGTITSVTLHRSGISDQNTLTNVYLYQGATRLTDGYSFNVSGQIVINGLNIAVNGATEISVKADVANNSVVGSGGTAPASNIAVALTSYTANGTASTVSLMGNTMGVVTGNLASASLSANTVTSATVNAGTTGYTFWSAPVQVNTRTLWLKNLNFKIIGSAPTNALSNMKVFIDGVDTGVMGTMISVNGSNYAQFTFSTPIQLNTGSHTVDFRGDVQNGSNRNLTASIQQAADVTLYDSQTGVNIAVSGTPNNAGTITISTGSATVVVDPTFTAQTNIPGGASNVAIGRFIVHAYGEDVKVSSLNVTPSFSVAPTLSTGSCTNGTNCGLQNVTLYFNGSQVGSQVNWTGTGTIPFSLGSQMIAPAGQDSVLEVRADLQNNSVAYTGGTVVVTLPSETTNAQGQSSQNTVGVPASTVATNGLSIQTGLLAVSKNSAYLNQSIAPNMTGVKIGSYTIQNQSTSEAIRITSFTVNTGTGSSVTNSGGTIGGTTGGAPINNFSALRTSDTTGSGSTPIQFSGLGTGNTSTDTFSVNDTLAPGASMTLDIFANTSTASSGQITTTLNVSSIGVVDNLPATSGAKSGQILTLGNGSITNPPTIVVSSTTPSQYIAAAGGATNASQATFSFVATSGSATITELKFNVSGTDATPTNTVTNVCVGSVCASPVNGVADLTGLSLMVPNGGGGLQQNVQVSYSQVGTSGIAPGTTSAMSLTYVKYTSGGSTATFTPSVYAPTVTLVGSKPTLVVAAGGNTGMVLNTSTKVGQVTITADPKGAIKIQQLNFAIGYTNLTGQSIASAFLALGGQSTAITGIVCTAVSTTNVVCGSHSADGVAYSYANDFLIGAGQSQQFDLYVTTSGASLVSGSVKASISSSLVNGSSTSATAGTTAAFLWDDTSSNGTAGAGLTGQLIYAFPTNAYSVSQ